MKTAAEWIMHWSTEKYYNLHDLVHGVREEAIAHARQECESEIERLNAELAESRNETEGWIALATDAKRERDEARGKVSRLNAELATLREQQPPAPAPQEPAESPLDKAAREALERHVQRSVTTSDWARFPGTMTDGWRRVVAPFVGVKDEPQKPVKTDGELLSETGIWHVAWQDIPDEQRARRDKHAATFLRLRAERDGAK